MNKSATGRGAPPALSSTVPPTCAMNAFVRVHGMHDGEPVSGKTGWRGADLSATAGGGNLGVRGGDSISRTCNC